MLRWLLLIPFALVMAMTAGLVAMMLASVVSPGLALLIGGGWEADIGSHGLPVPNPDSLRRNMAVALSAVPALRDISVLRTWAAIVNGTDDWKPILGEIPKTPGFFVNFFPWMGFTAGPIAARIVANLVQGKPAPFDIDMAPFLPKG